MEKQESQFEEHGEERQESILERTEIIAPENFVTVFHETKTENLQFIDRDGLTINTGNKNIGKAEVMARRNRMIDELRPETLKEQGISRESNIFAYPFLEEGHGLIGADQRFVKRDEKMLRDEFEILQKHKPDYLKELGTNTPEEFIKKRTDPEYLKSQYPGEVLEMKVDPKKCHVGDLEYITQIADHIYRGLEESEAIQRQAKKYWGNVITLEDFLKWYRKPEWNDDGNSIRDAGKYKDGNPIMTGGYSLLEEAPDNLPLDIHQPEILIPENVPQNHIKLVK